MEHNEMDKLFRNIINDDNSELKGEEIISKENIWNELDVPNRKRKFHFWKSICTLTNIFEIFKLYRCQTKLSC